MTRSFPAAFLKALRPQQWVKNGLVFLPFMFAIQQAWSPDDLDPVPGLLGRLLVVFGSFCALSGAVYLFNDVTDRETDRRHATKKLRPIASGKVGLPTAATGIAVLSAAGMAVAFGVDEILGGVCALYLVMNVLYSLGLKHAVLLDAFIIAAGYVIRAAAGAIAIDVTPSPWLYSTTAAAALFIVVGRRYAEVRLTGEGAEQQRPVLSKYAGPFIGQLVVVSAAAAWLSYTLYAVEAENLPQNDTMLLTIPLVTFGLFRYLYLLHVREEAESPEQLIIKDPPMVLSIIGWVAAAALILVLNN